MFAWERNTTDNEDICLKFLQRFNMTAHLTL